MAHRKDTGLKKVQEECSNCDAEGFINDISALCSTCPLPEIIRQNVDKFVSEPAREMQQLLPSQQFEDYLIEEINKAQNALTLLLKNSRKQGRKGWITQHYISNKEKIKALRRLLEKEGHSVEPKSSQPSQTLTFEELFEMPEYLEFTIDAMKDEEEPGPLLNDKGEAVLFDQAVVAPVWALVNALFFRKWIKDGIRQKQAYYAICNEFGFHATKRPDKSKKAGEGVYSDYLTKFKSLFLEYSHK